MRGQTNNFGVSMSIVIFLAIVAIILAVSAIWRSQTGKVKAEPAVPEKLTTVDEFFVILNDNKMTLGKSGKWSSTSVCPTCHSTGRTHDERMTDICLICGTSGKRMQTRSMRMLTINGQKIKQVSTADNELCLIGNKPARELTREDINDIINVVE